MLPTRRLLFASIALVAALAGLVLAAPATLADNTVTGKLAASPGMGKVEADLWTFLAPADGSRVTVSLTYSPNGSTVDPATGHTFDTLVNFNVYGDDGKLFAQSTLTGTGAQQWSFQSTSVHQYTVQVASYLQASPVTYSLSIQNATLAAQPTATPTPNVLLPRPTSTPLATVTPLPATTDIGTGPVVTPLLPGVLAKAGDSVQGSLTGALINTVQDFQIAATPDGSAITIQLTAQQTGVIAGSLAGINVYQMQGGVKVLFAVGLPAPENADVSIAVFPGDSHGYGDFIAEVYNGSPGVTLNYTLTRK
ncbi:MAG: hypothetical protein ACR2JY_11630 [Chloroflexota bacterium]